MKRFLVILCIFLFAASPVYSFEFSDSFKLQFRESYYKQEVKTLMKSYVKVANKYDYDKLTGFYSEDYVNSDGFDNKLFFKLIKGTWETYSNIKYNFKVKNIVINGDYATVEVEENSTATEIAPDNGTLTSIASNVYYLKRYPDGWKIVSDYIINEKTVLAYGAAKDSIIQLNAPSQILADTEYTASLIVIPPKNTLVIASIGQEKVTHPQKQAKEVFRKLPDDLILERVFKSNKDNVNEYVVASVGLTKADVQPDKKLSIKVSGLAYAMTRINVTPINKFIEADKDEVKDK
ncbi:hypothetical protein IJI31_03470 [bacterium]|nr:hypothetical protein [bacterium]